MALLFCDSFDHYTTFSQLWTSEPINGNVPSISTATPRTGSRSLRFIPDGNGNGAQTSRYFTPSQAGVATVIVGFAFYRNTLGAGTIMDLNDQPSTQHIRLAINSSNFLTIARGTTVIGTGTTPVPINTWVYIEVKVTIDDTAGVAVVKMQGTTEINLSSQDTRNGGSTATVNHMRFYLPASSWTVFYDDVVVMDTSGSVNNDFLGDVKVEALMPSGNGNSSQLVGSDGNSTDNYLLVDEVGPNDDTDYVESGTVGDKDTYVYGNLAVTAGTVYGVQVTTRARKTDAGSRSIVSVARLSGTEVDSSAKTLSNSYQSLQDVRETKPGGGAWSISDVNNAEFGVKVNA